MDKFGFIHTPFTRELSIGKRFKLDFFEDEVTSLKTAIEERMSALLVAPSGSGKSTVLRSLRDQLPEARYRCHYLKMTDLSTRDLWREIALAIGSTSRGGFPDLVRSIQKSFSNKLADEGRRTVIFIDEAHDMRTKAMSIIKIITNYNMDSKLVLSIILAGQPQLKNMLYQQGGEEIRRRLSHCGELRLLSRDESRNYVEHRIREAGASKTPFDPSALEAIFEISQGNLGAIDALALKSLQQAREKNKLTLDSNDIMQARSKLWI